MTASGASVDGVVETIRESRSTASTTSPEDLFVSYTADLNGPAHQVVYADRPSPDDLSSHFAAHAYGASFFVDRATFEREKTYGPYRRNGIVRWRNYRRPIKGGRSFVDLLSEHLDRHLDAISGVADVMRGPRP